jgi:pyruvate-formate lyase-activating enzyme
VSETQVVFFGAGQYATAVFEALNKKYAPVAYGDNDKNKQGTRFMGLPVLSLEQAEDRHPNCRFFITVGSQAKPYLMESLVAKGVDRSRIINFEEYDRHKSCWWLETRMFYGNIQGSKALSFCCFGGKNHFPHIKWSGETHDVAMKKFFAMRDGIIESLNRPDGAGAQNRCSDCPSVHDGLWSSDRRVRAVDLVYDSFCNFKCFYCKVNNVAIGDSCVNVEEMLNFLRFIKHDRHIDTHTRIHFAAGEISVHPLRDKILAELQDNPCWIFTNAGAYCEKIGEALSRGRCWLYPSIDAGTRGTFAKIKGVDLFDKVCENLHRYSSDGFVYLKYIVLPGVNDGEADVNGFVELCGRLGVRAVDITGDMLDMAPLGDHAIDMVAKMLHGLQSLGIVASVVCDGFSSAPGDRLRIEERLAGIRASHSLALAPTGAFGEAVVCYNGSSGRGALPQDEPVTI